MNSKTKKITTIAMLSAIAYLVMVVGRFSVVPAAPFLKYDPKDVIITLGGLIWGPLTSFIVSVVTSVIEMVTVSESGPIGCVMNIVSTCSFACTAAFIYKKMRTLKGAVIGLVAGSLAMVIVMLLWNYLLTPIYMGTPREVVASMLLPAFLPFNALKAGLNAAFTFLLYKPVITALRKSGFVSMSENKGKSNSIGIVIIAAVIIVTCILVILTMNKMI